MNGIGEAAEHYANFCKALGIDIDTEDAKDTPMRVAKMFSREFTRGLSDPDFSFTAFPITEERQSQLVIQCGIRFVSLCSHHHLPVVGRAHVCYIPGEKLLGLSKLARAVKWCAARPCVQEDLVHLIKDTIIDAIHPGLVGVSLTAEHECMSCRGVSEPDSLTTTNVFWTQQGDEHTTHQDTKQEFFLAISHWIDSKGATR